MQSSCTEMDFKETGWVEMDSSGSWKLKLGSTCQKIVKSSRSIRSGEFLN